MANISNRCSRCAGPMTEQDFQSNFEIHAEDGLIHKKCPSSIQTGFPEFWSEKFISNESQYSHQSSGSCTINALETAIRLQFGEKPSTSLINGVLAMASLYTSSMHTGVGDVLPHVTRYKTILKSIDWMQCNVQNIKQVIDRLDKNVSNSKHDVSCVITKPPESIFLHKTFENNKYILYDSHPRHEKGLNGSHILVFSDGSLLNDYLLILFPFVNLGGGYGLYGDMMNQCEATYLQIDYNNIKNFDLKNINYKQMSEDLSSIGFKLQKQYENLKNDSSSNLFDKFKKKIKNIKKKKNNNEYKEKDKDVNNKQNNQKNNDANMWQKVNDMENNQTNDASVEQKNDVNDMENNDKTLIKDNKKKVEIIEKKSDGNDMKHEVTQEKDIKKSVDENKMVNENDKEMKDDKNNMDSIGSMSSDMVMVDKPKEVVEIDGNSNNSNNNNNALDNNNDIETPSNKSEEYVNVHKPNESTSSLDAVKQ